MVSFLPFSVLLGTALVCAAQQTINPVISSDAHAITGKLLVVGLDIRSLSSNASIASTLNGDFDSVVDLFYKAAIDAEEQPVTFGDAADAIEEALKAVTIEMEAVYNNVVLEAASIKSNSDLNTFPNKLGTFAAVSSAYINSLIALLPDDQKANPVHELQETLNSYFDAQTALDNA